MLLSSLAFACREHSDPEQMAAGERRGKALFAEHCTSCHGIDGRGQALAAPPDSTETVLSKNLATRAFQADHSDEQIRASILKGVPPWMPAFDRVLSDSEVEDVVKHVRQLAERGSASSNPGPSRTP